MTEMPALRKVLILCALTATAGLSGCDNGGNVSDTLSSLKNVPVDAHDRSAGTANDKKLNTKDVALLVNTAKSLTTGQGGLLHKNAAAPGEKLQIAVVDPLDMTVPADNRKPLDERLGHPIDMSAAEKAAAHDLPDVPIGKQQPTLRTALLTSDHATSGEGRFIQVGSFSTAEAAQNAWTSLRGRVPGLAPTYQSITTASGKSMVRLRVGPVTSTAQAQTLCDKLSIRDTWCARAG